MDRIPLQLNPERLQRAFDLTREVAYRGELPTALLAVANARATIRCEAFGPDDGISTDGIYWIASITKPMVATAVMQLVERGRVLLEDPVVAYIPEFGQNGKEQVTVWNLLTHTSGMADDYWHHMDAPATAEKDLRGACETHLRFPPGSRFEYCNVSFRILGEIITRASGMPYADFLRHSLFEPAGMEATTFRPDLSGSARLVPVPDMPPAPGGFEVFVGTALPAGGLFSTAADLVAFAQAFLNGGMGRRGRVLGPAAVRVMTRLHTEGICSLRGGEPVPEYWALGWEKAVPREARLQSPSGYGHGGMSGGYLWVEPEAALAVVFLTNRVNWDRRARKQLVNAVLAALE